VRPWGGPLKSHRCFCCGSGLRIANHHITPREEGGSDSPRNKVTLCSQCHDAVEGEPWSAILARRESIQAERRAQRQEAQHPIHESEEALTPEKYFALPHTPAPNSPVGKLMREALRKFPDFTFEMARTKAHELLDRAAGKKIYRMPRVLSVEEEQAQNERLGQRFQPVREVLAA